MGSVTFSIWRSSAQSCPGHTFGHLMQVWDRHPHSKQLQQLHLAQAAPGLLGPAEAAPVHSPVCLRCLLLTLPFHFLVLRWSELRKAQCRAVLAWAAALPGSAALAPCAEPGTSSYTDHFTRAAKVDQALSETAPFGVLGVSFWINHLSVHRSQLPECTRLFTASQPCASNGSQKKWETSWKYTEHWQVLMGLLSCFKAILLTHYAATEGNYFQGKWLHDPG